MKPQFPIAWKVEGVFASNHREPPIGLQGNCTLVTSTNRRSWLPLGPLQQLQGAGAVPLVALLLLEWLLLLIVLTTTPKNYKRCYPISTSTKVQDECLANCSYYFHYYTTATNTISTSITIRLHLLTRTVTSKHTTHFSWNTSLTVKPMLPPGSISAPCSDAASRVILFITTLVFAANHSEQVINEQVGVRGHRAQGCLETVWRHQSLIRYTHPPPRLYNN